MQSVRSVSIAHSDASGEAATIDTGSTAAYDKQHFSPTTANRWWADDQAHYV